MISVNCNVIVVCQKPRSGVDIKIIYIAGVIEYSIGSCQNWIGFKWYTVQKIKICQFDFKNVLNILNI